MTKKIEVKIPDTVGNLSAAPYNYRKLEDRSRVGLRFSMEEFGDISGICFNVRTGQLVTGHQRVEQLDPTAAITNYQEHKDQTGTVGYAEISSKGQTWKVRFVDWPEIKEKAANVAANNPKLSGAYQAGFLPVIEELKEFAPEMFDGALLYAVDDELKKMLGDGEASSAGGEGAAAAGPEYDLSPVLYESYNYVVLLFRNEIDWVSAIDHFELKKVADPMRPSKVGLGCVIDGSAYLNKKLDKVWKTKK